MSEIDLHKEYNSTGESVQDLFDRTEEGFYVPLYQREYTWEPDNINQLFDDLVLGVNQLRGHESTTTFLGTTIFSALSDKRKSVRQGEERAQPTGVEIVIDGQQRISTLAILSIQIISKLQTLQLSLPGKDPYSDLQNAADKYIRRLTKLHAIELGKSATPPQKPKIISAREDGWTYAGDDSAYGSPVASYIAGYIRHRDAQRALDALQADTGARVRRNVRTIDEWLDEVCQAHTAGSQLHNQFPAASSLATKQIQEYVLGFSSKEISQLLAKTEKTKSENESSAAAIYQLMLLTYYLLRRCGVNCLKPTHEEWGFDMFQSLNATGTPLTVMETFLPQVMQAEDKNDWKKTPSRRSMDEIQELFDATSTNEKKNQRTNELLRAWALCYEGEKLGNKFSQQRTWLTRAYEKELPLLADKRVFLAKFARSAQFFYYAWYMDDYDSPYCINGLGDHSDGKLGSLLVRYLRDARSKLSAPILMRLHSQMAEGDTTPGQFIEGAKACAAFFTLWRAANSTSGLDDIYRNYFQGGKKPVPVAKHNWKEHPNPVTVGSLKKYFRNVLANKRIATRAEWIDASDRFLLYTELRELCRFVLFISAHDRVPDDSKPGLTSPGTKDTCNVLTLERWIEKSLKSIEHVAPQNPNPGHTWDPTIYADQLVHTVGNLILLPIDLNKYVDNKNWDVKLLHYSHVGERDAGKLKQLSDDAKRRGIVLSNRATKALQKASYNCAIEPVLKVGATGAWDANLILKRTRQIKELAWDTLFAWLQ